MEEKTSTSILPNNFGNLGSAQPESGHPIGWAIQILKHGLQVTRLGWNGKGQFIQMQTPDENSKMSLPYLYISTVDGNLVPWVASQTDLLATDWQMVS